MARRRRYSPQPTQVRYEIDEDDVLVHCKEPVSILGLPKSITEKLEHHLLFTVEQLMAFLHASRGGLRQITGIGAESAMKVADAIMDYRISYPKPPRKKN